MCTPTLLNLTHARIQRTALRREATIIINNGGGGARTCGEEAVRFTHTEATTSGAKAESEGILMKRIDKRKEELYDLMTEAHHKYGYGTRSCSSVSPDTSSPGLATPRGGRIKREQGSTRG
jgi:hypothetical protein